MVKPDLSKMTTVYLVLLRKGPAWSRDNTPDTERLHGAHLEYLFALRDSGELILNGPAADDGDLRGISVYRSARPKRPANSRKPIRQ